MRLFWKVLAVYFGAWVLLTAAIVAVLLLDLRTTFIPRSPISQNPPAAVGVQIAATHLRLGDAQAFRELAAAWIRGEPPFAVDARGEELLGRPVPPATVALARSLATEVNASMRGASVRRLRAADGQDYVLFYPEGYGPADRSLLRWLLQWPWLLGLSSVLAGLLLATGLAATWTRPIVVLQRAFDQLADGGRLPALDPAITSRRDEVGDLARHFARMAHTLARSVAVQRQLLHDVSHELRSPLARLTVAVELARRRPGETELALQRIEKESARLDRLIREVLTLARLESDAAASGAETDEYFDLLELLRAIHDDVAFEAEAVGVEVALQIPAREELVMRGRAELLHRAVENVVRNALQHAVDARRIDVCLEEPHRPAGDDGDAYVRVRIGDDGRGASAEDLDAFFQPFSHGAGSDGFGLGLAIAKRAVTVHGGTIEARTRSSGGVEVVIDLPHRDASAAVETVGAQSRQPPEASMT
ncbi:MAG: HAMP domain-containing sensor histidine kinase [Acidobacteriota bacterium]